MSLKTMHKPPGFLLLLLLAALLPSITTAKTVVLDQELKSIDLGPGIAYLIERDAELTPQQALRSSDSWPSLSEETDQASFGYNASVHWLRFELSNPGNAAIERFLEIAYPVLDYVDIYVFRGGELISAYQLGDKYPFDQRPIDHHNFIVTLELAAQSENTVLVRVQSSSSVQIPITIWQTDALLEAIQQELLILGLYFGAIVVLILYNLFIFLSVREKKYLFYVLYMAGTGFFLASLNGLSFQYLWPNAMDWNDRSIPFSLSLFIFFATFFIIDFLDITPDRKRLRALSFFVATLAFINAILSLTIPYSIAIVVVILSAFIAMSSAVFLGILRLYEGYRPAVFYCLAWAVFFLGGFVLALNKFTLLPRNVFTETSLQLGSVLEGVLLSFALADRLNQEKSQRLTAQAHALEVQRKANEALEEKVSERTRELETANRELENLTFSDALTGVRNRRYFDEALKEELGRCARSNSPLSLLLIDLDHFKQLNDTHGHVRGDECLKKTAAVMQSLVNRNSDVVARYGGEEFVILLPETDLKGSRHLAETVREAIEEMPFGDAETPVRLTASVGLHCALPEHQASPSVFIDLADQALYRAKGSGRNRVCISDTSLPSG